MPLVIGLGTKKPDWKDPLGIYGGKAPGLDPSSTVETKPAETTSAPAMAAPDLSPTDRSDIVNTIIAEAAGEGPEGMAAVASVIRNRAQVRGKSPAEVVREPDQFTGYSAPGPDAKKAMEDPELRKQAESILDQVLAGALPDATGGADHYHATSVTPYWSKEMPKTADIGQHRFYKSEQAGRKGTLPSYDEMMDKQPGIGRTEDPFEAVLRGDSAPATAREPKGRGMADLLPDEPDMPTTGKGGVLNFVHEGQDKLDPTFRGILEETSAEFGRPFTINSGYRGASHPVEARKAKPGMHSTGTASDVSMKGMNEAERAQLVRSLQAKGVKRFGIYKNSPDMLHVDMKDQTGTGKTWFMYDRTNALMPKAPAWFQEVAKNPSGGAQSKGGLRPFQPGERRENSDGSYSTEITTTWQLPDGKWVNVPSLWMGEKGPQQFEPEDEGSILGAMQDFESRNGQAFPRFSSQEEAVKAAQQRSTAGGAGAPKAGTIVLDENFKPADGMNVFAAGGANPFQQMADEQAAQRAQQAAEKGEQFEQTRVRALNEMHNRDVGQQADALGAENPGRYGQIDEADLPAYQQQWEEENKSTGLAGDTGRILKAGVIGVGQSISSLADTVFSKIPGGDKFLEASDNIDRWVMGNTLDQKMENAQDKARASVTDRQQEADAKNWWDEEKGFFGPAWTDPRSYLRVVGESAPGTVVTMFPGGILARGAYVRALAGGATQRAAAATAARTATISGALIEGTMGGADSAKNVRDRIAAMPRDQLVSSDAVQDLINGGMTEEEAIKAISEDAASQAFVVSGVATGMFGGLGDRALAKIIAEGVGGGIAKRIVAGGARGFVAEGIMEEAPQGAAQTMAENLAMQTVDPDQELTQGVGEAVAAGVAAGGVMGGGMGAAGGAASRAPAPAEAPPATDPGNVEFVKPPARGPIGRSVQRAEEEMQRRAPPAPVTAPAAAVTPTDGRPEVGATVRVDAEGMDPFMARIDGYEGDEAVVIDGGSGEVYQIPIGNLTPIAKSPEQLERENPSDKGVVPIDDEIPAMSTDPALEPLAPIATERKTGPLPPKKEQKSALERFPTAPDTGSRVIVDNEEAGRFPATVETWVENGTEVVVKDDQGNEYQVPASDLYVSKLTEKQVEKQELERNPPVERDQPEKTPTRRQLGERFVDLPDERHARLYDLARQRYFNKRTGESHLDLHRVDGPEHKRLADEFGVTTTAIGAMADDYRYRVERAAKEARSNLPVKMPPVNDKRLRQWQRDRAREQEAENAAPAAAADMADWWDLDLDDTKRRKILDEAGIKRSERMKWAGLGKGVQTKLEAMRNPVSPIPETETPIETADAPIPAAATETMAAVDARANEAATSPENDLPEPTQAQKEAGNYKVGRMRVAGLDLSIENPAGSQRKGVDPNGKAWSVDMKSHYGYIRGSVGRDKDHIDTFVKPGITEIDDTAPVFVVDQRSGNGRFDEHKVMMGFDTLEQARAAYMENYAAGWKGLGDITQTSMGDFKQWLRSGKTTEPFAPKWFGSRDKAEAYVTKQGLTATHDVVESGKRFEVRVKQTDLSNEAPVFVDDDTDPDAMPAAWVAQHTIPFIHKEMTTRVSPVDFVRRATTKEQIAALIEPGGKILVLNSTTNPDGDHAEFFSIMRMAGHDPSPYIRLTSYGSQIGVTGGNPLSEAAAATVRAVKTVAEREAVTFLRSDLAQSIENAEQTVNSPTNIQDQSTAAAPEPARAAPAPAAPKKKLPLLDRLENYYRPGRDVESYGGETDRVISFDRGEGGTNWTVTVAEVRTDGTLSPERMHSTMPSEREMARWERDNPVPEKPKAPKQAKPKLEVSANTVFTDDAAEKARALLRKKLSGNTLNSGIDPELMQAGITLAGYHIEKGARTFAAYASAMVADLGDTARPFLKSWYMGVKYDPRAAVFDGMSSAAEVEAADVNAITGETDEPAELEGAGAPALEGASADQVQGTERGGNAGRGPDARSGADVPRGERARTERVQSGRSVADEQGDVPPAAGRGQRAAPDLFNQPRGNEDGGRGQAGNANDVEQAEPSYRQLRNVESAATPAQNRAVDFSITDADRLGEGGQKAKFNGNMKAIKLLRTLDEEKRAATRDEQSVLAQWVGWGGLRQAFYREDGSAAKGWEKEAAALKELLSPEEYSAAESSTRNAHYTSPQIVGAVWDMARRLGFRGGQVLEPSVGAGNFLGLMPGDFRDGARVTGVELDRITGGIAKNLYPSANIQSPMGFEKITVPNDYFDLAIGNPPFGSEKVYDKERRHLNKLSIHNFFFAKSMEAVRPGGVLAMVVTNRFLDGSSVSAREMIAKQADLVGAIRLPNNAFLKNAGTEVTTDIVLLRKRLPGEAPSGNWTQVGEYKGKDGKTVPLNRYFIDNPSMMLGDFGAYGTMYGPDDPALVAREGQDLPADLARAIRALPENVMVEPGTIAAETVTVPETVSDVQVGAMFAAPDGTIHERLSDFNGETRSKTVDFPSETAKERVAGMVRIRDAFARLRRAQIDEKATETQIENLRKRLNAVYDGFTKKHGPINADANKRLFRDDPTWPQIAALENAFDKGISATVAKATGEKARAPSAQKAPIFTKRTQQPYRRPTSATSAKDALAAVLNEYGAVNVEAMARLYGKPAQTVVEELGPLLYKTPAGNYDTADSYLSGNVKQKLAEAERAAEDDPDFRRNVNALRDVIPADIDPVDIDVKPGSPWIPAKHIEDFLQKMTESAVRPKAFYSPANARWVIDTQSATPAAKIMYGTDRASIDSILSAVLNGQSLTISDKNSDGGSTVNEAATAAANEKAERVKAEWRRWIWEDDARRDELARLYNDTFNTDVMRVYDGSHLTLPGKVGDDIITLRPHQKNFIWRTLQSGTALADHTVGAGKTFAAIASIMEKRRTGQARKPVLAVPNHLVGQWAADFIRLYPGAKVLAATKRDFEKQNRKQLFARVATGDWDVVIVAHSSFGKIGMNPEYEAKFIAQQMEDLEASITELRQATGEKSRNVAQLSKWRDNLKAKMERLLDAGKKDDGLTFDELGVDALYVDEFHEFKNLPFATGMQRVAGLGNPAGSQKATDLYMKMQFVLEKTGGNNVVTLTGTPLSNTMAEMYTVQRYLDGKALRDLGVAHFDAWARVFGEVVTDWELSPSGQYKLNSRFAKFVNMPELMQRYLAFADVITNDDIKAQLAAIGKTLPLPKVKGGKPQNITVERSPDQAAFIGEGKSDDAGNLVFPQGSLVWRAENLPKKAEKGADNMLKVMSDARKAALDMRLIDPSYGDAPGSKVNRAADEMKRLYDQWADKRGTQLVFIDLSTPKKAKAKEEAALRDLIKRADEGDETAQEKLDNMSPDDFLALQSTFSVYDDLREKLIAKGIPAEEIAFIHDANTEAQKEELFGKVRSGRIRFMFGSTPKMGAGTNVQNRLVALHHLDAPWRPSDLEQRDGRGIRQGNELYDEDPDGFEIEILRYATKNTLDARQWQGIEAKARFIQQVRKGNLKTREIEDIAGEASNAAEMKAAASGNPLILEEMETRRKLRTLEQQSVEHDREQHRIKSRVRALNDEIASLEKRAPAVAADAAKAEAVASQPLAATFGGETFDKPKEFGAAVIAAMRKELIDRTGDTPTGTYGDFKLSIEHQYERNFDVVIDGDRQYQVNVMDAADVDATGLAMRVINTVKKLSTTPAQEQQRITDATAQIPALEKQLGEWPNAQELEDTAARHRRIVDALKPKKAGEKTVTVDDDAAPPVVANKRPDPVGKGNGSLQSLPVPERPDGEDLQTWGRRIVLEKGRATDHEYLLAIDDDGSIVEFGTANDQNTTGSNNKLVSAAMNPDRRLVLYHNHPNGRPLSGPDIAVLALPGMHSVYAFGHNGADYRATATPEMREYLAASENPYDDQRNMTWNMRIVLNEVDAYLNAAIDSKRIDRATAEQGYDHAMMLIAERAGIIDFSSNQAYDPSVIPGFEGQIDELAARLAKAFFKNGRPSTRTGRPSYSVRHVADVAGMDAQREQVARPRAGAAGLSEGGARNDPAQGRQGRRVTEARVIGELKGRLTDLTPAVLKAIPLNYFPELARPNMTAVNDYLRVKRLMDAFRGQKHADADTIAGDWLKYARLGFAGKDKAKAAELADLMHDSTLAGVDPSQTDEETKAKPGYTALRRRFVSMPPKGRELYQKVRDAYAAQQEELDEILLDNVRKAQEIALARADERYKRDLQKIKDAGLKGIDLRNAEQDAASAHKAETTKAKWAAKARMTKMRIAFESTRVEQPYFPLGRFGRYFVTVRDVDGAVLSFSKFERAAERDRFAKEITGTIPGGKVEIGVMEQGADLRRAMDPRIVAEIEEILGGAGVGAVVMDQIWQRYLESMPDLSARKRFIHRKGTQGFSGDALRVFSSHMFHSAHQMARLKYGLELQELVDQTFDQAKQADDQTSAMTLANEMSKRHDWVMNPTGGKVAQTMTSAAFVWFLASSPAAAAVNMTQTVMMGLPILAGRFGSMTKAAAALGQASLDSVMGKGSVTNASLSKDERQAMDAFYGSGLIDRTQSHDLAGVGDTGVEYSPLRARVMGVISWAFHRAEVWNREVTALAAYRMARESGASMMQAIDMAHELTWKTHFDYSNSSRPAVMQNDFAKVALVFRQHNVNMLYRIGRDIHQSLKGESKQARREARYQLGGVVGMQALMAGTTGVIGFNLAMAVLSMIFGDEDDPLDFAERFKADVVDILGPELGGVVLNGAPGHYLGIDLSSRIGMPDLWFRSPNRELQGRDEYQYWLSQSLGATVALGESLFVGAKTVLEGETARGIEMAAPKAIRDIMKAYRYYDEGLTTFSGDTMMTPDQMGWHGVVAQAIGFSPAQVAETWDRNSALKNAERRILDERQRLVNKWGMAVMDGDKDGVKDAIGAIAKFNGAERSRGVPIKSETLERSIKTRVSNAAKREDGVLIRNKVLSMRLREALAERVYD